jgi:hypothetical protein
VSNDEEICFPKSELSPSYCTVKNSVAGFRAGHLSTADEEPSGRLTQVTVPENVDSIRCSILDDPRISAKNSRDPGDILRKSRLYYL